MGSGQVSELPSQFTWTRLTPKDLFPDGQTSATWEGGIACANTHGVVTDYWNSQIVFTASASDPTRLHLAGRGPAEPWRPSHKWLWLGVALIVLSILLAAPGRLPQPSPRPVVRWHASGRRRADPGRRDAPVTG